MNNKVPIAVVVIILLAGGFFLFTRNNSTQSTQSSPAPTNTQDVIAYTTGGFSPASLTVKAGTTVTWVNKGGGGLSLNSGPHPFHTDYSPLNIGVVGDGQSKSLTFDKPGTYGYHNHLNTSDTGEIIVQ